MTSQMNNLYQPLDDDEIAWLGEFLLDRIDDDADTGDRDEGILDISELDGFLTAVVSGPVTVLPSQWIPQVWGDFEPVWEREQDVQKVMTLLMRHMNAIAVMLMEQPEDFEPIFLERQFEGKTHTIVDEWCEGYMRGVALAADQWELDERDMPELLAPIMAFQGEQVLQTHDLYDDEEVRVLQQTIPDRIRRIHLYWLSKRTPSESRVPPSPTTIVGTPKVGRNDPCPCGSGKKYKKCCLQ
ncbi:MAG: UPF0149 family protein [Sedimenticolaceae bacterium]